MGSQNQTWVLVCHPKSVPKSHFQIQKKRVENQGIVWLVQFQSKILKFLKNVKVWRFIKNEMTAFQLILKYS